MSKYVPPHSRKHQGADPEVEKRRQRALRFLNHNQEQNGKSSQSSREKSTGKPRQKTQLAPQYGFVSRGEESELQKSESAQRDYFDWILATFGADAQNIGISEPKDSQGKSSQSDKLTGTAKLPVSIDSTLTALRRLREAMLHQKASDFSVKVHLFSIRVSTPVARFDTYVPSINYLLMNAQLLTESEKWEICTLLILHVSHHNNQNEAAFRLFQQHLLHETHGRLYSILLAWAAGDYYKWLSYFNNEPDHCIHAIMAGGLARMAGHMVNCMTKSYFTMLKLELEGKYLPSGVTTDEFLEKYAAHWLQEEVQVVIRRRGK